jgi:hypothetical protein
MGADTLWRGLGFSTRARRWTAEGDPVQEEESQPKVGDDMWGLASEREAGRARTGSAWEACWAWAEMESRPDGFPRPLFYIFLFFLLFYFYFPI